MGNVSIAKAPISAPVTKAVVQAAPFTTQQLNPDCFRPTAFNRAVVGSNCFTTMEEKMAWFGLTMNPEAKAAWVQALRSAEYPQGREALLKVDDVKHKPLGLCCLGVFCMVKQVPYTPPECADGAGCKFTFPNGETGHGYPDVEWFTQFFTLDTDMTQHTREPNSKTLKMMMVDNLAHKFAKLNDDEELNFGEIADWIEANL